MNWLAYSTAAYLNKDYKLALEVLDSFEKTITTSNLKID